MEMLYNSNAAVKPGGCCKYQLQRLKQRTGRMFGYCSRMQPPSQKITCILNVYDMTNVRRSKMYSSPVTGLEWPRRFQKVKVPRFHDNGTGWW